MEVNVSTQEPNSETEAEETGTSEETIAESTDEGSGENTETIEHIGAGIEAIRAENEVERWSQIIQNLQSVQTQNQAILAAIQGLSVSQLVTAETIAESETPTPPAEIQEVTLEAESPD